MEGSWWSRAEYRGGSERRLVEQGNDNVLDKEDIEDDDALDKDRQRRVLQGGGNNKCEDVGDEWGVSVWHVEGDEQGDKNGSLGIDTVNAGNRVSGIGS